jgi:hypothetical protein
MADALRFGLGIIVALAAPALAFILIRAAMRMANRADRSNGASSAAVNGLRAEVDDLRGLPPRMAELEERLDFAERMLTQQREAERLGGGANATR